jgi:diguanylate cyclase (GGDEF)-like protein
MNTNPISVKADCCIKTAVPLMSSAGCSCLIIVDEEKPIGIVTERDITQLFCRMLDDSHYPEHPISEVMTSSPICVQEDSLINDALALSRSRRLRHLPVIKDDGKLVGVVTQTNLVDTYVKLIDLHAELETSVEELTLLSLEDALTGIGNRRAMEVDLAHTEQHAKRTHIPYSVALLDIDFFKKYNDHYGHQTGDQALKQVAEIIDTSLRASDRVFRYGGEEFLILMPGSNYAQANNCAQRVRQRVLEAEIPHCESEFRFLTISIGVAESNNQSWKELTKQADKALYQAKHRGRNQVVVAEQQA